MTASSDLAYDAILTAFGTAPGAAYTIGQYADAAFLPRPESRAHKAARWQDLTSDLIVRGHAGSLIALISDIMEPADWRYYLPAYMLASLKSGSDGKRIRPSTMLSLYPGRPDPDTFRSRVDGLTQGQCAAILLFLQAVFEDPETWIGPGAKSQNEAALEHWRRVTQGLEVGSAG